MIMAPLAALLASISVSIGALVGQPGRQPAALSAGLRLGAPVATLSIPRVHFDGLAHQGIAATVLALGPGHYPSTALPGQPGTTAFAGHRVTHTHPFLDITLLRRGDIITVATRWGRFRYQVYRERIVSPSDVSILRDVGYQQLVLTACHPPHTALDRYVVFARRIMSRQRRITRDQRRRRPVAARTRSAMSWICRSEIVGNIGSERTSRASCSVTGNGPATCGTPRNAGCRWAGKG